MTKSQTFFITHTVLYLLAICQLKPFFCIFMILLSYAYPWLPSRVVCICTLLHLLLHRATNLYRGILLSNPAWGRSSIADKWRYVLVTSLSVLACLQEWLNVELSLLCFLFQNSGIGCMTASNEVAQGITLCFDWSNRILSWSW